MRETGIILTIWIISLHIIAQVKQDKSFFNKNICSLAYVCKKDIVFYADQIDTKVISGNFPNGLFSICDEPLVDAQQFIINLSN